MRPLQQRSDAARERADRERQGHLAQWRSAARRVEHAWELWLGSARAERGWAHEVYLDALDREEQAASRLERDSRALQRR